MKKSITQEFDYGCGIACFAFVTGMTYKEADEFLGYKQAKSPRFWCKDIASELNRYGINYIYKHVKPKIKKRIYQENAIVLVARSKRYPVGHYLVRYNNRWMDPWINLPKDNNIKNAKSGFRKRLPSRPMYVFFQSPKNDTIPIEGIIKAKRPALSSTLRSDDLIAQTRRERVKRVEGFQTRMSLDT